MLDCSPRVDTYHRCCRCPLLCLALIIIMLEGSQCQTCYDVPGWHDDGGIKWDCEWYGGDVGLDDYYADGDTRCSLWGSCCEFAGHTANTACCACGGGFIKTDNNDVPSVSPTLSFAPTSSVAPSQEPSVSNSPTVFCRDIAGWYDIDGPRGSCSWYAADVLDDDDYYSEDDTRCALYGHKYENFGMTANDACCVCGGGYYLGQEPTLVPSVSHKPISELQLPSYNPTNLHQPSISSDPSLGCVDIPNWHAIDGARYDCIWFGQPLGDDDTYYIEEDLTTRCEYWGSGYENMGHVANTACCVCGGGLREIAAVSSSPSITLDTSRPSLSSSNSPTRIQITLSSMEPTLQTSNEPTFISNSEIITEKPSRSRNESNASNDSSKSNENSSGTNSKIMLWDTVLFFTAINKLLLMLF